MDRLSTLMSRFELRVQSCASQDANFLILGHENAPRHLQLIREASESPPHQDALAYAKVSWGGASNPLLTALPETVLYPLTGDPEMLALTQLFIAEMEGARCGVASVLNRLGEVLIVRLMRSQIEAGSLRPNVIAALADPRLSRAVVAIHDRPEHPWRLDSLAQEAGLSASRFADVFRDTVGQTPLAYLRQWRLILARQDIERGDRIQTVAVRYCYGSSEALSRAFSAKFGCAPRSIRTHANQIKPDAPGLH